MLTLVRELARDPEAGVDQVLVTLRGGELARRAGDVGVAVRGARWSAGLDPRALWRVALEIRRCRPAIVHAHNGHALSLAGWALAALGRMGGAPRPRLVATRRVTFAVRPGTALFRADRVIAISEAVRSGLVTAGLPPARIALVPSGIDAAEVRRVAALSPPLDIRGRLGLAATTPIAVNIAALEAAKDQATLIEAAARGRALRGDLHWVIAGAGPLGAALDRGRRRLDLTGCVHLIGATARPEALLREANVVVMSSREEGLGTVVLDALALEKPVVATRAGGLPEIVPEPWLVPVGDAESLARKVVAAVEHPSPFPLPRQFTAVAMARGVLAVYRALA